MSILHFSVAWLNYCGTSCGYKPQPWTSLQGILFIFCFFLFFPNCSSSAASHLSSVFPSCTTQKHMLVVITRQQMGISTFSLCTSWLVQIILQTLKRMKLCVPGCKMLLRNGGIFSVSNISVSHVKTFVCSRYTTNKERVYRTPANSGSSHTKIKEFAWQHFCYCCSNTSD